jgi:hypothetical protein
MRHAKPSNPTLRIAATDVHIKIHLQPIIGAFELFKIIQDKALNNSFGSVFLHHAY